MKRIESMLNERETVARTYRQLLETCGDVILPVAKVPQGRISWFAYVIRLQERYTGAQRDAVLSRLASADIACGRYFGPIHMQPCYREWRNVHFLPVTESISVRTVALPFFNKLTTTDLERICSVLRGACLA
jgi:perosamine synthetase